MATVDITPLEALELIGKYLSDWKLLTVNDVVIEVVSGGYCNRLYRIKNTSLINTKPNDLLIRLYGGKTLGDSGNKSLTEPEEVLLFNELSNRGLGPKLFGVFPGGMLTEFVQHHILNNQDLENSTIRKEIARNIAKYHSLVLPVNKSQFDLFEKGEKDLEMFDGEMKDKLRTQKVREVLGDETVELMTSFGFKQFLDWCRNQLQSVVSPVRFCLLDMNRLNCLIRDELNESGERVMLIDYDLSRFAPRGMDIGNHFSNYSLDIGNAELVSGLDYPSEEVRREFVEEYLKEFKKSGGDNYEFDDVIDSVDHVLMEAEFYGIVVNLVMVLVFLPMLTIFVEVGDKLMNYPSKLLKLAIDRKKEFIAKYGEN